VTYTAGYSTVPADLQFACFETVLSTLKRTTSNSMGTKDSNKDGTNTTYEVMAMDFLYTL